MKSSWRKVYSKTMEHKVEQLKHMIDSFLLGSPLAEYFGVTSTSCDQRNGDLMVSFQVPNDPKLYTARISARLER